MSEKQREGTLEKNRLDDFDLRELIFVDANIFIDSLHLSVMKRLKIKNIATRDSDFERVRDITIWSP